MKPSNSIAKGREETQTVETAIRVLLRGSVAKKLVKNQPLPTTSILGANDNLPGGNSHLESEK